MRYNHSTSLKNSKTITWNLKTIAFVFMLLTFIFSGGDYIYRTINTIDMFIWFLWIELIITGFGIFAFASVKTFGRMNIRHKKGEEVTITDVRKIYESFNMGFRAVIIGFIVSVIALITTYELVNNYLVKNVVLDQNGWMVFGLSMAYIIYWFMPNKGKKK